MGAVLAILLILKLIGGILGLWLLVKALEVSLGWFLFLLPLYMGAAGVVWAELFGPVIGTSILLGGTLMFVVNYWREVRALFLLFLAANVVHAIVVVEAGRALERPREARTEQAR